VLPVPRATIGRVKGRAHKLLLGRGWGTRHLSGALLAVLISRAVILSPIPVFARGIVAKREQLPSRAAKRIDLRLLGKAFGGWFIVPKNGNPGRNSPLFQEGIIEAVGVARIGYEIAQGQLVGR
jgi:hypothetical protein